MSFIAVATGVVSAGMGVVKLVQGNRAAKAAAKAEETARIEMDKQRAAFEQLDTSNPYKGMQNVYDDMENTMEDLTVNQQQAQFEAQQNQQNQANILASMSGAAGSSGIAALAQSLASSGALQAQKAAASIGEQETANQKAAAEQASAIQELQLGEDQRLMDLEREGELKSRQMEADKVNALMGLAAGDVSGAQALQASAQQARMDAMGDIASGAGSAVGGYIGLEGDSFKEKRANLNK